MNRKPHDNSAHQQAIEIVRGMGWETSRFVPAAVRYLENRIGETDSEIRGLPRIVPDLYRFTDVGVLLIEVENTSRAVGRKMDDLLEWFMLFDSRLIPFQCFRLDLLFKQLIEVDFEGYMVTRAQTGVGRAHYLDERIDHRLLAQIRAL